MELLKVSGNKIVDGSGKEVRLRGTCIGGWMNMENFINGYPGCESGLRRAMYLELGREKGEYFFESLLDSFVAEEDIVFLKSNGANVIRPALNYRHFEDDDNPFNYKESGFARLDRLIDICEKHEMYVILDMHAVQGWQNSHWHSDNECCASLFWRHKMFQDRLKELWKAIAKRYVGRSVIAGYELMNEPIVNTPAGDLPHMAYENYRPEWDLMNRVYKELVDEIRSVDPDHIIFIEGDCYGHYFDGLAEPFADNLVYSSHNYNIAGFGPGQYPGEFNTYRVDQLDNSGYWDINKQRLMFRESSGAKFAAKHNVPLWVGEFGAQYNTGEDDMPYRLKAMDDQLKVFNEFGAHWTTWTYKDMGVMGWVTVASDSEYAKIVEPVQRMKTQLGAENFVGWYSKPIGKEVNKQLANTIKSITNDPFLQETTNASCLALYTLTGYAAAVLQPLYCKKFKGMTKNDIDRVMKSFTLKDCVVNEDYLNVLKKNMQ